MDKNRSNEQHTSVDLELLQDTIRQQAAMLQAKGRLVDNMAYQIKTLSNAIIGFSDLLLTESLSPDQLEFAEEIHSAGKGLSNLVNEVLDWARLETGRLQITRSVCVLSDVLEQLDQMVRPVAVNKDLSFELQRDPDLPETVWTDSDRLLKCLMNLTANAIQYTEKGFVRVCVGTKLVNGSAFIRFDIIDSGPGIAPKRLERLFEPAMAEEDAYAQVVNMLNFGLSVAAGLPLTQQLVELLGGTIEVESEVGKGSVFTLLIPAHADAEAEAEVLELSSDNTCPLRPQEDTLPDQKTVRPVLLAEDQESNRTVIRLMLKTMGYAVETAVDGQEAVEMALSKPYSLILMDLKMPRMDGYEAAARLREHNLRVPIVALSAISLKSDEKKQITELFDGFLSKPVDGEQLLAAVQKYAAGSAASVNAEVY